MNITRCQLQIRIWNTPMKHLAKAWSVDCQKLTRLCEAFDIERPLAGYWTQHALGKTKPAPDLNCERFPAEHLVDLSLIASPSESSAVKPKIGVSKRLTKPHPKVKLAKALYQAPTYKYDCIWMASYPEANNALAMSVSEHQLQRALRIMDALLKYFQKQGWLTGTERECRTLYNTVTIGGQKIRYRLREELKQHTRELSAKELEDKQSGGYVWHERINRPSGNLILSIGGGYSRGDAWRDSKSHTLESLLPDVIIGMEKAAERTKQAMEKRLKLEAQHRHEGKIYAIAETIKDEWGERIDILLGQFGEWQRAEACRTFIHRVRAKLLNEGPPTKAHLNWINWASDIAERLDPVTSMTAQDLSAWNNYDSLSSELSAEALAARLSTKQKIQNYRRMPLDQIEHALKNLGRI